jgi:hypothetical protein
LLVSFLLKKLTDVVSRLVLDRPAAAAANSNRRVTGGDQLNVCGLRQNADDATFMSSTATADWEPGVHIHTTHMHMHHYKAGKWFYALTGVVSCYRHKRVLTISGFAQLVPAPQCGACRSDTVQMVVIAAMKTGTDADPATQGDLQHSCAHSSAASLAALILTHPVTLTESRAFRVRARLDNYARPICWVALQASPIAGVHKV